jgi:uncharacterized SAM-binding protein YcdF (DUF218 family)
MGIKSHAKIDLGHNAKAMIYYLGKALWLFAAPTSAFILISGSAGLFAVLGNSPSAAWLAATAACGLVTAAFTPIGLALTVPLETRFPLPQPDPRVSVDGIIMLPGGAGEGIAALSRPGQEYPKARLALCGFGPAGKNLAKRLAEAGIDAVHINIVSRSRTTAEDAHYSAALLQPKPDERWLLITAAMHMPRAVGCFRAAGFQLQPYPLEFMTRGRSGPFALFSTGSSALIQLDRAAKEWIGLVAYRLIGKTDALFPGPKGSPAP